MKQSYVYIILCNDNTYYTGVTTNVYNRFIEHKSGFHINSYTFKRRPLKLVYYCEFLDLNQAIYFEKKIMKWSQEKKKALIEGRFEDLPNLAKKGKI